MKNIGIYNGLISQLDKINRHNRQGSFHTKKRYYEAMKRFCAFVAEEFHLQKLSNLSEKHLTAYVIKMQVDCKSASTIKTDLSAIRFYHDKIDGSRHRLPNNSELEITLQRRKFGNVDKTWSNSQFNRFCSICTGYHVEDYSAIACLARYAGLRIHECFRIDTAIAEDALRKRAITIKGKGGLMRTVPIGESIAIGLRRKLTQVPRGEKLFVLPSELTHVAIHRLQVFIAEHRSELFNEGEEITKLIFHGLRHTYAAEQYLLFIEQGLDDYHARVEVSKLLGHNRDDVTKIYLVSVKGK